MHQAKCPSQQLQSMQLMSSIQSSGRKQSGEPSFTFIYRNAEMCFRSMTHPDRAAQNETKMRPSAPSVHPTGPPITLASNLDGHHYCYQCLFTLTHPSVYYLLHHICISISIYMTS